ncbi:MAG: TRAP transporter large permease subunit [Rhodospirillaceae bacterium]|nr:TRAP transporter large permease subunit [Rhodospirillaceae bacterium]
MEWYWALILMLGLVCAFMAMGLPVAFAFFLANIAGALIFLGGEAGLISFVRGSMASVANFSLAPIPLFILMGEVLFHTGVAFAAVNAIARLIARVPGRLSIVSVAGGTVFSALSGSTIANTAMLGSVLLPDMLKRGYHPTMAMGPIMAVGGIAMLIPPSALAVLLGSLAKIPVADLLVGGIVPGLLMSVFFIGYIVIRCAINPSLAPADKTVLPEGVVRPRPVAAALAVACGVAAIFVHPAKYDPVLFALFVWLAAVVAGVAVRIAVQPGYLRWYRYVWGPFLVYVLPLFTIFAAVLGSIFAGVASPTDSAALGTLMSVIVAACYRRLSLKNLITSLIETAKVSAMIFFIIAASSTFSQILAFSGATDGALAEIAKFQMTPLIAVLAMLAILLFLGCFLDQVSMLLLTLPFFMPLAESLKLDVIWLGVMFLLTMEVGLLTPPFGLLLFVMKGVAPKGTGMGAIYRAATAFIILEVIVLAMILAFPGLATWLPERIAR